MKKTAPAPDDQELILSNVSPSPAQRRLALVVVLVLLVCSVGLAGPLSTQPLGRIDAFMPAYGTAIFVSDSITAVLLFAQFFALRSPALLALASGYLWSGFIAIPWVLTFPGVLPQSGPLGAGLQSTPWLYLFWHEGFILSVILYVLLKDFDPLKTLSKTALHGAVLASIASVAALVVGATVLVTAGHALMPPIMVDTARVNPLFYLLGPLYAMTIVALVLLWLRLRSVLDLWLVVVLFAFIIEVTLSVYPSPARFTAGWYGSRVYALLYSSLVLLMLLIEIAAMGGGPVLTVGVGPTLAVNWLIPRLISFYHRHPEIEVRMATGCAMRPVRDDWTCTIRRDTDAWPGYVAEPLLTPARKAPSDLLGAQAQAARHEPRR